MPNLSIQRYTFKSGPLGNEWYFTIEYSIQDDRLDIKDIRSPNKFFTGPGGFVTTMPEFVLRDMVIAADAVRAGTVNTLTGSTSGTSGSSGFSIM